MKNGIKSGLVALVLLSAFSAAFATNSNSGCQGNCASDSGGDTTNTANGGSGYGGTGYGGTGVGVGVGVGVGLGGSGGQGGEGGKGGAGGNASNTNFSSNSAAAIGTNTSSNTNTNVVSQGQNAMANGGAASSTGGIASSAGGAATGIGTGNITSVKVDAPIIPKPSSANAYAPDSSAPRTSCRIFVGLGGTGRDGSLSGGIPIGNDQTCLTGAAIEAMDKANKVQAGTFLIADYLLAICKMEGMASTEGCKAK